MRFGALIPHNECGHVQCLTIQNPTQVPQIKPNLSDENFGLWMLCSTSFSLSKADIPELGVGGRGYSGRCK